MNITKEQADKVIAPPEGKLLCARCEANAVAAGIASSYRVTGLARLAGASPVDPPVMQRLVKALHCWMA